MPLILVGIFLIVGVAAYYMIMFPILIMSMAGHASSNCPDSSKTSIQTFALFILIIFTTIFPMILAGLIFLAILGSANS